MVRELEENKLELAHPSQGAYRITQTRASLMFADARGAKAMEERGWLGPNREYH